MKEYLEKIYSIISDARINIIDEGYKAQENLDEEEKKKIKLISLQFDTMLEGLITFKDEIEEKIEEKIKENNNTGVKIVLNEEPLDDVENQTYAYEGDGGIFIADEDPVIIETKSGKKIVLDDEPEFYINSTGNKIVLDEDPDFKIKKKIVLDEDPISLTTRKGKRVILDEDPVKKTLKSNKVIILSEDPLFKIGSTGKSFTLDEDPNFKINNEDTNQKILSEIEKIRELLLNTNESNNKKVIYLDEDPVFNLENNGNSFVLNEDQNTKIKNKIVLDEDPVSISINVDE